MEHVIAGFSDELFDAEISDVAAVTSKLHKGTSPFKKGLNSVDPDLCVVWAGNTRDLATLNTARAAGLAASIATGGQKVPVIARVAPDNPEQLEIVAGACRLNAIRQNNELRAEDGDCERLMILVEVRDLDDDAAFKLVSAENSHRSDMTASEKSCFYGHAIDTKYGTEQALAEALNLNKSTVNRTMAIRKVPGTVLALIKDPHRISAAQASSFMADWNKPELRATMEVLIEGLAQKPPASASKVFKALKDVIEPDGKNDESPIQHNGEVIGAVRKSGKDGASIKLLSKAKAVPAMILATAIADGLLVLGYQR